MSYLVLARKYRPRRFSEVVGQSHVVKTLRNALRLGKLTHALLFSGIKGTGKTTIARIVAKALNCLNLQDGFEPCNECLNCQEINKGIFVDVLEIDAASNRGIDQVRELIETLKYAPARGRAKVYIIDEAHMLTKEAANALLKSLEEPPSHVYFILATTEPNRLPPTILSRCQRYDFRRLDLRTMVQFLKSISERESYAIESSALELIAKEAQGSMRDALSLLDQAMAYGVATKEELITALGWHEEALVEEIAQILLEKDLRKALTLSQNLFERGLDLIYLTEKLTEFFRALFLAKALPEESSLNLQNPRLRELLVITSQEDLLLILHTLLRDLEILKGTPYPQLQFELTLAKICEHGKLIPLQEILKKLEDLSKNAEGLLIPQNLSPIESEKSWASFLETLKIESPPPYSLLSGLPEPEIKAKEINLSLKANKDFLKSTYMPLLKEKVESYFGKKLNLIFETPKRATIEEVKDRPEVKLIAQSFSAKIINIQPLKE
ncbi:DNA polymerase III subunit gamma/tau [Caldimicrobium thiodismutans]|uniref:DNA polymerase III subunit gamma/tau n=1 Tax=Caldimicrobium thiodismutans TaxID=1653476 RepID=A0A0U5AZC8_9BACT|nr:DNA polymerase III subunit gamma/tau [Caldimicrobium thiodismutans]BAU23855.1 DNA polymerase III subunit gamma/tau [Caldimicrobium thiodismutans]